MEFDVTQFVVPVVAAFLGIAVTIVVQSFFKWRDTLSADEQWLTEFIGAACEIAERVYLGSGRGKEKLAYVIGIVESECAKRGVNFDKQLIVDIVDKYVLEVLNAGQAK